MIDNFLIQCKTRRAEVLEFLAVALGGYVLGIIVMMVIRANTMEENECVTLGVLIAAIMLGFVHLFGIIFSFIGEFNMALSMGAPARSWACCLRPRGTRLSKRPSRCRLPLTKFWRRTRRALCCM